MREVREWEGQDGITRASGGIKEGKNKSIERWETFLASLSTRHIYCPGLRSVFIIALWIIRRANRNILFHLVSRWSTSQGRPAGCEVFSRVT